MHVEIQVALNFFISFLYNKLPRRRVNQFGEELEKALKRKFQGHWYPEKPFKGSAFRCIKTAPPLDPVFDIAAQESGMSLTDIEENLPEELSIWIDPGEVSYRLGEKGVVKILYSESESSEDRADREIYRTFNPEAQCFKPIDGAVVTSQLGSLSLSSTSSSTGSQSSSSSPYGNSPSPTYKSSSSPISNSGFLAKSSAPLTFTTATFAQTKFGSTKLKTNGKRCHRMSPTEFSSYIKQRALIQQQQQQHHQAQLFANIAAQQHQRPRSLSPTPPANNGGVFDANSFLLLASAANLHQQNSATNSSGFTPNNHFSPRSHLFDGYLGDLLTNQTGGGGTKGMGQQQRPSPNLAAAVTANPNALSMFFDSNKSVLNSSSSNAANIASSSSSSSTTAANSGSAFSAGSGAVTSETSASSVTPKSSYGSSVDNQLNFGVATYPSNQHLLMAN